MTINIGSISVDQSGTARAIINHCGVEYSASECAQHPGATFVIEQIDVSGPAVRIGPAAVRIGPVTCRVCGKGLEVKQAATHRP